MKYNFTDRTRKVLAMAREEAIKLQHDYVGTEHILLGLLREEGGTGSAALRAMGVDGEELRKAVAKSVHQGNRPIRGSELPYTSRAKKVLEYAMAEARELDHRYVGTEHFLLGLLREKQGIAATVLGESGITIERARATVLGLLGEEPEAPAARTDEVERHGSGGRDSAWYLLINEESRTPIYEQIIARIEEAVATGMLEPGERLPSVRDLAGELEIAPGTVARAYSELEKRGIVQTEGSKGTRVADSLPSQKGTNDPQGWLEALLRKPVVAAFHHGATAQQVREALERAMRGILKLF